MVSENKDVKNLVVIVLFFFCVLFIINVSYEVLWIVVEIFDYLNFDVNLKVDVF